MNYLATFVLPNEAFQVSLDFTKEAWVKAELTSSSAFLFWCKRGFQGFLGKMESAFLQFVFQRPWKLN